jgi:ribonuclease HI
MVTGDPVVHKDLVKYILAKVKVLRANGQEFRMEWVKGHSGDKRNDAADALAKGGRWYPQIPDRDWVKLKEEQEQIYELL